MSFTGVNYVAIVVAAVAAFVFGAIYYGVLSKPWMKAARITPKSGGGGGMAMPPPALLINSIVCELIMAWVLAAVLVSTGSAGIAAAITAAFFLWLGFIATTVAVNQRYQSYGWDLTVIDAIHWLGVALIMGIILGWWS
jgi:hypothetical protein